MYRAGKAGFRKWLRLTAILGRLRTHRHQRLRMKVCRRYAVCANHAQVSRLAGRPLTRRRAAAPQSALYLGDLIDAAREIAMKVRNILSANGGIAFGVNWGHFELLERCLLHAYARTTQIVTRLNRTPTPIAGARSAAASAAAACCR